MHDVMRQRLLRRIEALPEDKIYQVLDYIEFLESKYARDASAEASGLQKFAENITDRMRKKAMNPETIREAFQLIAAADRVLAGVSSAGKQLLDELGAPGEGGRPSGPTGPASGGSGSSSSRSSTRPAPTRSRGPDEPPPAPRAAPTSAPEGGPSESANPSSGRSSEGAPTESDGSGPTSP